MDVTEDEDNEMEEEEMNVELEREEEDNIDDDDDDDDNDTEEEDFYEEMVMHIERRRVRDDDDAATANNALYGPRHRTPSPSFGRPVVGAYSFPFRDSLRLSPGRGYEGDEGLAAQGPVVHEGFVPIGGGGDGDGEEDEEGEKYGGGLGGWRGELEGAAYEDGESAEEDEEDSDDEEEDGDPMDIDVLDGLDGIPTAIAKDPDFSPSGDDDRNVASDSKSSSGDDDNDDEGTRGEGRRGASRGRAGRGRPRGRGRGRGQRGGWRAVLRRLETPPVRRRGRGRGRGRGGQEMKGEGAPGGRRGKRGPIAAAEPSVEFKRLQAEATEAFLVRGDKEAALEYARQAVQNNPEIFAAHSLLSEILLSMGRREDSVGALLSGAHTKPEPKLWWHVADRTLELGGGDKEAVLGQAYYCYTQIIRLDPTDYEARAERLKINLELGYTGRAKKDCETMLKLRPDDMDVLRQLAELYTSTGEAVKAKKLYEDTIERYTKEDGPAQGEFTWSLLNIFLDLLDHLEDSKTAISKLRTLSRWLLGRKDETYWDEQADDSEWDLEDEPRRLQVERFEPGKYEQDSYGRGLPLEIRVKLGVFRSKLGTAHFSEAMVRRHLSAESLHGR